MTNYNTLNHCQFLIQYHLIWCPKFGFDVLKGEIETRLKELLYDISERYGYEIKEMEIMPDHIHVFISTKPTVAPTDVVRTLKSISTIELLKEFSSLKHFYARAGSLWSKGYFASTIGNVSEETVKRYIQQQKQKGVKTNEENQNKRNKDKEKTSKK